MNDFEALQYTIRACFTCGEDETKTVHRGKANEEVKRVAKVKIPAKATRVTDSSDSPVPGHATIPGRQITYMFVGESPGENEDRIGEGFTGKSGKYLRRRLIKELAEIDLDDCAYSNIVKCHPLNDRNPYASEIKACSHWLEAEIRLYNPEVILAVGKFACEYFIDKSIGATHGQGFWRNGRVIIPLYHPAGVNRAIARKILEADYKKIKTIKELVQKEHGVQTDAPYKLVKDREDLVELLGFLQDSGEFGFDIETIESEYCRASKLTVDPLTNTLASMQFSLGHKAFTFFLPFADFPDNEPLGISPKGYGFSSWEEMRDVVCQQLQPVMNNNTPIIHNAIFEMKSLDKYGLKFNKVYCTQLGAFVTNEETLGLKDIIRRRFQHEMLELSDLIDLTKQTIDEIPLIILIGYGCDDAYWCYKLAEYQRQQFQGRQENHFNLMLDILPWIVQTELEGIDVDIDVINELAPYFKDRLKELEEEIYDLIGNEINLDAPKQVSDALFKDLEIEPPTRILRGEEVPILTDSEAFITTNKQHLKPISYRHPVIRKVLDHGSLSTIYSTFIQGLPKALHPETGKLHASINQTSTRTTRFSMSKPFNVQNIPIRDEMGKRIRNAFHSGMVDWWFWSVDQSQIELRWAAHLSKDEWMIEQFRIGNSIHRATCMEIFEITEDDKAWDNQYKNSKNGNFARLYGAQKWKLAETLEITVDEAAFFLKKHQELMPGFDEWVSMQIELVKELGYVETYTGYRRQLPMIKSPNRVRRSEAERYAINTPIQGGAQSHIQLAMVEIWNWLKARRFESRLKFQVHDELTGKSPAYEVIEVVSGVKERLEDAVSLTVATPAEAEVGPSWGEMIPLSAWIEEHEGDDF